eukprot:scaffold288066_cov30-Tisochrysis_lutea.AAC.2
MSAQGFKPCPQPAKALEGPLVANEGYCVRGRMHKCTWKPMWPACDAPGRDAVKKETALSFWPSNVACHTLVTLSPEPSNSCTAMFSLQLGTTTVKLTPSGRRESTCTEIPRHSSSRGGGGYGGGEGGAGGDGGVGGGGGGHGVACFTDEASSVLVTELHLTVGAEYAPSALKEKPWCSFQRDLSERTVLPSV